MADYFFASICFPVDALKVEAIHDLVRDLYNEGEDNGIVCYNDPEARYGQFEELERLLIEQSVPFDRYSAGYGELDPQVRHFRPARGPKPQIDITFTCTASTFLPVIHVCDVKKALREKSAEEYLAELEREYPEIEPLDDWVSQEG